MKLIDRQPQRLFAFGCSYTQYAWATWPEIVAHDLSIPMYNAARSGAGNQYIANLVAQLNQMYRFGPDDLVMIAWSGFFREDRWIKHSWRLQGDFELTPTVFEYPETQFSEQFVEDFSDPLGYLVRDFASIALVKNILDLCGCQYQMFSIYDIPFVYDQERTEVDDKSHTLNKLITLYHDTMRHILPSFDSVLWQGDQHAHKAAQTKERWNDRWTDWHPTIDEQYLFLKKTFSEHQFSDSTEQTVDRVFGEFSDFMRSLIDRPELLNKHTGTLNTIDLPEPEWSQFNQDFHIVPNNLDLSDLIW